jgi:hypothetical protein
MQEGLSDPLRSSIRRVISDYQSPFPTPLRVGKGQELAIGSRESEWPGWIWCTAPDGQSGWVPESYVARRGDRARVLRGYDASELSVRAGEEVAAGIEESGWIWCTNQEGQVGWVPAKHLSSEASGD